AQAPQFLGALLLRSLEHRLERLQVAVDVGENDRFHGTGCRAAERGSTGMRGYSTDAVRRFLLPALLPIARCVWVWTSAVRPASSPAPPATFVFSAAQIHRAQNTGRLGKAVTC